jgi:hypothetical protein
MLHTIIWYGNTSVLYVFGFENHTRPQEQSKPIQHIVPVRIPRQLRRTPSGSLASRSVQQIAKWARGEEVVPCHRPKPVDAIRLNLSGEHMLI